MTRHIDQMLEVMRDSKGQKPRLVHRIDRETSGCLLIAKTRFAASHLTGAFRSRSARKVYWALVPGLPKPKQGRISTFLAKEEGEDDTIMKELILKVVDEGDFFEIADAFAKNIVTGFGRIAGRTVGFVANQPMAIGITAIGAGVTATGAGAADTGVVIIGKLRASQALNGDRGSRSPF